MLVDERVEGPSNTLTISPLLGDFCNKSCTIVRLHIDKKNIKEFGFKTKNSVVGVGGLD